jgi:hypothetical protein
MACMACRPEVKSGQRAIMDDDIRGRQTGSNVSAKHSHPRPRQLHLQIVNDVPERHFVHPLSDNAHALVCVARQPRHTKDNNHQLGLKTATHAYHHH